MACVSEGSAAFADRCPHRNAPLSQGKVVNGHIQCPYHGWQFDRNGQCQAIPGLDPRGNVPKVSVDTFPSMEQEGFTWVWMGKDSPSATQTPFSLPFSKNPHYRTVYFRSQLRSTVFRAAENILDVPHTSILHQGLFRKIQPEREKQRIDVRIKKTGGDVEAEYIGENPPSGFMSSLLMVDKSAEIYHADRFFLPSTTQVEYRLGDRHHILATTFLTPENDESLQSHVVINYKLPFPHGALAKWIAGPFLWWIFRQDAKILSAQSQVIHENDGERFTSSKADILGPHIRQLLQQFEATDSIPVSSTPEELRTELYI